MDFNRKINRQNTASEKWDGLEKVFGVADVLPMWVADMDFAAPLAVRQALQQIVEHGVFGYTMQTESYYQAIVYWMKKRHQWDINKDWIVFSPGVVPALSIIVQAFTEPNDKVIIQTPVYPPFYSVVESHGRQLVQNPLRLEDGKYVMDYDGLEKLIDKDVKDVKLLILCSPHNPNGRVWSQVELSRLAAICARHQILVVSDEIHADLLFEKGSHTPYALLSKETEQHSIVCTSPSKTFNIAGLNTSNIIIPNPELRNIFEQAMQKYALGSITPFGLAAAQAAYQEGEEWLDECLSYIQDNMSYVIDYIETHIPELKVTMPEATYLLWIDFRELGISSEELATLMLNKAKIAFNNGTFFGEQGEGFMRMNVACPREIIEEVMIKLETTIQELRTTV
ncbi:cystathionine beta-lyase [Paenibacillus sp. DS2015]|uniref:MalY/PatB family protein n=1 Tax=Paenibacillus sp. DS2015 TaxID=3373917 RepID=UPI003D1AAB1A